MHRMPRQPRDRSPPRLKGALLLPTIDRQATARLWDASSNLIAVMVTWPGCRCGRLSQPSIAGATAGPGCARGMGCDGAARGAVMPPGVRRWCGPTLLAHPVAGCRTASVTAAPCTTAVAARRGVRRHATGVTAATCTGSMRPTTGGPPRSGIRPTCRGRQANSARSPDMEPAPLRPGSSRTEEGRWSRGTTRRLVSRRAAPGGRPRSAGPARAGRSRPGGRRR